MSKEPLVTITPDGAKPEEKQITFVESLKTVIGLTVNPIIGSFAHPLYLIINASTLGHSGDYKQLAGFGLGSLTLGMGVISIGSGFAMGAGTLISQAFGAK
jgi:Na+-driven multidrug efflux pump